MLTPESFYNCGLAFSDFGQQLIKVHDKNYHPDTSYALGEDKKNGKNAEHI